MCCYRFLCLISYLTRSFTLVWVLTGLVLTGLGSNRSGFSRGTQALALGKVFIIKIYLRDKDFLLCVTQFRQTGTLLTENNCMIKLY